MNFDQQIDGYKEALIQSAQELIRIKSTEEPPVGNFPFGEGVQNLWNMF